MDSVYKALSVDCKCKPSKPDHDSPILVTELHWNECTRTPKTQHCSVLLSNLSIWLNGGLAQKTDGKSDRPFVRLAWVELNERMRMSVPQWACSDIADAFDLEVANQYCSSHFTGVAKISQGSSKSTSTNRQSFSLTYLPKLAVLWSHTPDIMHGAVRSSTHVLVHSTRANIDAIKALLDISWDIATASHPMFPLLLCSLLFSKEVHGMQENIKVSVREVEVRTGYHRFANRRERPATGELGELCARMSGCETKLASVTRELKTLEVACDFMSRYRHTEDSAGMNEDEKSQCSMETLLPDETMSCRDEIIAQSVVLLRDRVRMHTVDNDYVKQRVRIQIEALFSLIAQHDSLISLRIAQASKLSAMSSQQDSSSMKTIAVVTMLFLPGSFVSGLFSINFFDWSASPSINPFSVAVSPAFGLYCAIVISLTVVVFAVYALWLLLYRRKQTRLNSDTKWETLQPAALEEVKVLSLKRETLYEK